jgi:(1->4)-alpha-D-glucan 1-alpha-D-glucosylmutase
LWNLSLVDPDNRRPVDYGLRDRLLRDMAQSLGSSVEPQALRKLLDEWRDGRIKLYLTWQLVTLRRDRARLFRHGSYEALQTRGRFGDHICAFARIHEQEILIVVASRLLNAVTQGGEQSPVGEVWVDTNVQAPRVVAAGRYRNLLTGEVIEVRRQVDEAWLSASQILENLPVAVLAPDV